MYDYLGGKSMTDAEQREAARQFVNRWMGKCKERGRRVAENNG